MNKFQQIFKNGKFKIIIAIVLAFIFVKSLNSLVFLGNTPRINTKFIAKLKDLPKNILIALGKLQKSSEDTGYYSISKGVEAADGPNNTKIIKIKKGTKIRITTYKDASGKIVKIITPLNE